MVLFLIYLFLESVGKTSLISTMMFDTQGQRVKKLNKVSLSPERCIYSKDIFTQIIDTDLETDIKTEIQIADIILLVYDISNQETIQRIQNHWLPIISAIQSNVPVILVGNKLDKKQLQINKQMEYTNVRSIIKALARKYRQVQMGFQCSAYYDRNVKKVLNCAQRAVLYPLAPLYDLNNKQLTQKFKKAIKRIFRILDKDLDGKITDSQLRSLQQRVFQTDLNGDDIKAIKEIILKQLQQFNEDHIELNGFFALQKKCIQMLKIQVCWSILRYFNYNDNLQITQKQEEFILDQNSGQTLELSQHALNFLQRIYAFSLSQKAEGQSIMGYLFSCSPYIPLEQFKQQNMSLQKFLLSWMMFSFIDYRECYRSLLYIGYEDALEMTFKKIRSKKTYSDLQRLKERKIFTVLIVEKVNDSYENYLSLLFKNAVQFKFDDYILRDSFMFNQDNKPTKVLHLLKINEKYLEQFMEKDSLKNRIDLVLTFENDSSDQEFSNYKGKSSVEILNLAKQKFASHTMFRKFSQGQCGQVFKVQNLPSLNLQSVPIQFKGENWSSLFSQIVKTFQKLQIGYSVQKLQKLKKQSNNKNKLWTGLGIVGVTVLGCLALKKNPLNFIKELK